MAAPFYESDAALEQYLLFHFGTPEQICPLLPEARAACGFPTRCVSEPLREMTLTHTRRALDLGCAVGAASFELAQTFDQVVGIDFSARFIAAARDMQQRGAATVHAPREGNADDEIQLKLPAGTRTGNVHFETGDACDLRPGLGQFDLVLLANLIDRLPHPRRCLQRLPDLVAPGGWLIITSPYTWLEEYTPRDRWLDRGRGETLAALQEALAPRFELHRTLNLPFLIREHRRKFQWSVAEASIWK